NNKESDDDGDTSKQKISKDGTSGGITQLTLKNADDFKLHVEVEDAESWIEIRKGGTDGKEVVYDTVAFWDSFDFDLDDADKVYFSIGQTSNVILKINDQSFEYPTDQLTQKFMIQHKSS